MTDRSLSACRILVVEDEYMLANELHLVLEEAGALVLGPAGSVAAALRCVDSASTIDGAILDVNLGGEMVFPVADHLAARGVPFLFASGYDRSIFPPRFADAPRCGKPLPIHLVTRMVGRLIRT